MSSSAFEELLTKVGNVETDWHASDIHRALEQCENAIEKPGNFVTVRYENGAMLAGRRAARVVAFMTQKGKVRAHISSIETTACEVIISLESIRAARQRGLSTYGDLEDRS